MDSSHISTPKQKKIIANKLRMIELWPIEDRPHFFFFRPRARLFFLFVYVLFYAKFSKNNYRSVILLNFYHKENKNHLKQSLYEEHMVDRKISLFSVRFSQFSGFL